MLPATLAACYFLDADPRFARLASVLAFSASQHCADWSRWISPLRPKQLKSALDIESHVRNTQKMEHWYQTVEAAPEGARLLLIDADTMILRPLEDVWASPFDFAYTTKDSRFPFNSGVVFVRVSDATRAFFRTWRDQNHRMLTDKAHHKAWRAKYGGINQASLGFALESQLTAGLEILALPCQEWNCEDSAWPTFDPAITRIVHVKSALRRALFAATPPATHLAPLVEIWRSLDRAARKAA